MPRPASSRANPFRGRFKPSTYGASERRVSKLGYQLQREQAGDDGATRWVTLSGHDTIEPLLAKAYKLAGSVRVIDRKGREVVKLRDGVQL